LSQVTSKEAIDEWTQKLNDAKLKKKYAMIKRGRAYKTSDASDDINADHSLEGTDK